MAKRALETWKQKALSDLKENGGANRHLLAEIIRYRAHEAGVAVSNPHQMVDRWRRSGITVATSDGMRGAIFVPAE